jgi:hypothetical protein
VHGVTNPGLEMATKTQAEARPACRACGMGEGGENVRAVSYWQLNDRSQMGKKAPVLNQEGLPEKHLAAQKKLREPPHPPPTR